MCCFSCTCLLRCGCLHLSFSFAVSARMTRLHMDRGPFEHPGSRFYYPHKNISHTFGYHLNCLTRDSCGLSVVRHLQCCSLLRCPAICLAGSLVLQFRWGRAPGFLGEPAASSPAVGFLGEPAASGVTVAGIPCSRCSCCTRS